MKNIDYSDEFSTLKELHEENIGRKFTDEEFNEIFSIAEKENKDFSKHADRFQNEMMGLLMTLDEATHRWEGEKLMSDSKGNPKKKIQEMIADLGKVIDYYVNDKNANWGTVGTLSNIHESLGKQLYIHYDEHLGYSRSIEEGLKRHSEAARNLLLQASSEVKNIDAENHLHDLLRWKKFFEELMEGFQGTLHKIKMKEKLTPELRKKLEEIFSVSQSHAISAWVSELLDGRKEITEEDLKKIEERYKVVEQVKKEIKFDIEESESKPQSAKPDKPKSLREEAIELARKSGDKELAKYLQNAPLKSIQRRIKALREEVEKRSGKPAKKHQSIVKKWTTGK
ncbi:MAG: hypothetical protein HYY40_13890 [Bacteroidetes bacterium]|nr:hypothetical protein [Bacteroidota bacterium]